MTGPSSNPRPRVDQLTDDMLDQLYAELDALKTITTGYCPHCGRGDCSPTADQWLEQRQRAEQAEDAIARVRAVLGHWEGSDISYSNFATQIRAALDITA